MIVSFRRTGQRRYAIEVQRPEYPEVEMNPAPGYNPLLPHDVLHMVAEAHLGLTRGIFGQLAAGGSAGTFHLRTSPAGSPREGARRQRRAQQRGARLVREGRSDSARSERAAYVCWYEWLRRSDLEPRRQTARRMAAQAQKTYDEMSVPERLALDPQRLQLICRHLDEVSSYWARVGVGEAVAVRWPDLALLEQTPALGGCEGRS